MDTDPQDLRGDATGLARALVDLHRHEQRFFRLAEQTERHAVAGVDDDAIAFLDAGDRLADDLVEAHLHGDLQGDAPRL